MFDYSKWLNPEFSSTSSEVAISAISAIYNPENSRNSGNSSSANKNFDIYKKPSIAEVREFLGEDWCLYSNNVQVIECWMGFIVERKMMVDGVVPPSFVEVTCCSCCGYVYVPSGMGIGGRVLGCPWCSNKNCGLPVPVVDAKLGIVG